MKAETSNIIGLFGGTFNPPHIGHVKAAKAFREQICGDGLIVMPSHKPPHKSIEDGSPTATQRLELCALAFGELGEISDYEITREAVSYTYDTVKHLGTLYPGKKISLYVGTDMLFYFEKWYKFEWLLENVTLAVASRTSHMTDELRTECERLKNRYGSDIILLELEPEVVSSTEIRDAIKNGGEAVKYLPAAVYDYIKKNGLYGLNPKG